MNRRVCNRFVFVFIAIERAPSTVSAELSEKSETLRNSYEHHSSFVLYIRLCVRSICSTQFCSSISNFTKQFVEH